MSIVLRNYTYAFMVDLIGIQRFAEAGTLVNTTTGEVNAYTGVANVTGAMSVGMKTYYDTEMLENARNKHYFAQFGKKITLPANHGMTVEWRKWNTLPMADVLKEAVIPTSKRLGETAITGTIRELGMYITISRRLQLHHVDDVILGATEELGASAGDTQDVAIRNALAEGTNVLYADKIVNSVITEPKGRYELDQNCLLTPDIVNQVYTMMRKNNVPEIDGKYIGVIPACSTTCALLMNGLMPISTHAPTRSTTVRSASCTTSASSSLPPRPYGAALLWARPTGT